MCNPTETHDFFISGYLKEKVYNHLPCKHQNVSGLNKKVRVGLGKIPEVMVQKSFMDMNKRVAILGKEASCGGIKQ
jgi:hypothetical protein